MSDQNPWISVWMHPRETVRAMIQSPTRSLWVLAFIYGFASLLNFFQSFPIALRWGMLPMLLFSLIVAPFWGYAFFNIWSWFVAKVGKLLKGQGDFVGVRTAYAWSCVPLLGNIPFWILLVTFYSDFLFYGVQDHVVMPGAVMLLFLILILINNPFI